MNETTKTKVAELTEVKCLLSTKDETFATSLCDQWAKKKRLSDKQVFWVEKLAHRALNQGDDGPDTAVKVGEFGKMLELFQTAGSKLKYPSLTFLLPNTSEDVKLVIKRAGPKSKYNGDLMLTDGGPYGCNQWYGRIDQDGVYQPSKTGDQFRDVLVPFLTKFAADPHGTATNYGHKTGNCCFCRKKLSHEKSTTAGYGETCAKNWGLHSHWKAAS